MKTRTYATMVVSLGLFAGNVCADQKELGSPFILYQKSGGILPRYERVLVSEDLSVRAYWQMGHLAKRATGRISRSEYMAYAAQIRDLSRGVGGSGLGGGADQMSFKLEANWNQHSVNLTGLDSDQTAAELRADLDELLLQLIGGELDDDNLWLELVTPPLDPSRESARGLTILKTGKLVLWKLDHRGVKRVIQRRMLSEPEREAFKRLVHDHRLNFGKDSFGYDKRSVIGLRTSDPGLDDFDYDKRAIKRKVLGALADDPDLDDFDYDKRAIKRKVRGTEPDDPDMDDFDYDKRAIKRKVLGALADDPDMDDFDYDKRAIKRKVLGALADDPDMDDFDYDKRAIKRKVLGALADDPDMDDFNYDKRAIKRKVRGTEPDDPDMDDFDYDKRAIKRKVLGASDPDRDSFDRYARKPPIIDGPAVDRESFMEVPVNRDSGGGDVNRRTFRYDLREAAPEKSGLRTLADWVLVKVLLRALTF